MDRKQICKQLNSLFEAPSNSDLIKKELAANTNKWREDKARLTAGSNTSRMVTSNFKSWKDNITKKK